MNVDYTCLKCNHTFPIGVTESELQTRLDEQRVDLCPQCAQPVGTGPVRCRECGTMFVLVFPHSHLHCDLANGLCPECGAQYVSLCIC